MVEIPFMCLGYISQLLVEKYGVFATPVCLKINDVECPEVDAGADEDAKYRDE